MKSLTQYINEAKDDNLHQFIKYLQDNGTKSEMPSGSHNSSWIRQQMRDTKIDIDDIMEESDTYYDFYYENRMNVAKYFDIAKNDWTEDDATKLDYDDMCDLYWAIKPEGEKAFLDYVNDKMEELVYDFDIRNGMIYVERAITLPDFSGKDNDYERLMNQFEGHIGTYWSWEVDASQDHWGTQGHKEYITFYGWVDASDVNWHDTKIANLSLPDEKELTLNEGAKVYVNKILTRTDHNILKTPLLIKA